MYFDNEREAFMRITLLMIMTLATCTTAMAQAESFFAQVVLQGVTFQVESPNNSSIN